MKNKFFMTTLCLASMITTSTYSQKFPNIKTQLQKINIEKKKLPSQLSNWLKSLGSNGGKEAMKQCLQQDNKEVCNLVKLSETINDPELIKIENSVSQATKRLDDIRKKINFELKQVILTAREAQDVYYNLPQGVDTSPQYERLTKMYQDKLASLNKKIADRDAIITELRGYVDKLKTPLITSTQE